MEIPQTNDVHQFCTSKANAYAEKLENGEEKMNFKGVGKAALKRSVLLDT